MQAPRTFAWASRLVRLTAPLVPRRQRDDWRTEWLAELSAHAADAARRPAGAPARSLLAHALGAPVDAFWMRQRAVADTVWIDDLRHGSRQFRQQAGFTLTAVGILAVGIAACVAAFSIVSQTLLRPLPYPQPDRIVTVWERRANDAVPADPAPGNFLDWRERATSFSHLAAADPHSRDYTGGDRPEVLLGTNVTEGFFDVFGLPPLHGRFFRPEEHQKGAGPVVVLSAALWHRLFASDPAIVGRSILLNQQPFTVVGITADDFEPNLFPSRFGRIGIFVPKAIEEYEARIRMGGYWQVVGRLSEGRTLDDARAEMETIAAQIEQENPRTNTGARVAVLPLREHLMGNVRPALLLFAAAVVAVLLIACVNVTNLLLARGAARQQELAIRTALGASRRRLVGQLLVESLLLSAIAATAGTLMAAAAVRTLARVGPRDVLWIDTLHVDGAALAFAALLAVAVAVAAGLVPALKLSGTGLQASGGARTATGDRGQQRLRSMLVAAEVALALVLVCGTALLLRSFVNLLNVDTGFATRGVVALQVFAWDRHQAPASRRAFFERSIEQLSALPGVEAAGAVTAMPFIESNIDIRGVIEIEGQPAPAPGEEPRSSFNVATPGYFDAMRIPILRGRHLGASDGPDAPPVAVISEALAARYWGDRDPIGDRIAFRSSGVPTRVEIVGVVGATRHERLEEPRLELFVPHAQSPSGSMTFVARTGLAPQSLIAPAQAAIWTVDPLQTFYRTATLDELVGRTLTTRRFALIVLIGFATIALLLAAAGLYGVLTAIVSQYRRELGVRMALGAGWLDIVRLVVARGLAVVVVGVAAGLAGVLGMARVLDAFLFSVAPGDPATILASVALMLAVSALACFVPAHRAASSSPTEVLRME